MRNNNAKETPPKERLTVVEIYAICNQHLIFEQM
jgi:hypothetical protein